MLINKNPCNKFTQQLQLKKGFIYYTYPYGLFKFLLPPTHPNPCKIKYQTRSLCRFPFSGTLEQWSQSIIVYSLKFLKNYMNILWIITTLVSLYKLSYCASTSSVIVIRRARRYSIKIFVIPPDIQGTGKNSRDPRINDFVIENDQRLLIRVIDSNARGFKI